MDTDAIAREVVAPQSDGFMEIARVWPQVVRDGALDRTALAEIVFSDPVALATASTRCSIRTSAASRSNVKLTRAPGGSSSTWCRCFSKPTIIDLVDKSILVIAPDEDRIARVAARDRIDEARVRARMAAQISPEEAQQRADFVDRKCRRPGRADAPGPCEVFAPLLPNHLAVRNNNWDEERFLSKS